MTVSFRFCFNGPVDELAQIHREGETVMPMKTAIMMKNMKDIEAIKEGLQFEKEKTKYL